MNKNIEYTDKLMQAILTLKTPEELMAQETSFTGQYLKKHMEGITSE